jgi:uncharacterized protein (DUF2384 family)
MEWYTSNMIDPYPFELRALSEQMGGQSAIATFLNVHRSRITRWLGKEQPDRDNKVRIAGLFFLWTRLIARLKPATAHKWLHGINAHLGNQRPIDLIKQNRIAEVAQAIEQLETGSYS